MSSDKRDKALDRLPRIAGAFPEIKDLRVEVDEDGDGIPIGVIALQCMAKVRRANSSIVVIPSATTADFPWERCFRLRIRALIPISSPPSANAYFLRPPWEIRPDAQKPPLIGGC